VVAAAVVWAMVVAAATYKDLAVAAHLLLDK
jgi:hypothetical protein